MQQSTGVLDLNLTSISIGKATENEVVVREGSRVKVIVPECPLAAGALKIMPRSDTGSFSAWENVDQQEAYSLIQGIVQIWEKKGVVDYLIYGKESGDSSFGWEVVPYPKEGWWFWKQFNVLWNITFTGSCVPKVERERVVQDFQKDKDSLLVEQIEVIKETVQGKDPFCDQEIIAKQLVFEGKKINLLYNYAPIAFGEEKLHFLIVPKEHRPRFSDLTEEEYLETMQIAQKLVAFYKEKGYETAYLFDKTGAEAGQTIPHWHEHLVFTATKTQELLGQLMVLKNMMFWSSPLPAEELKDRVDSLSNELVAVFKEKDII